jgi:hypothetical protein
MYGIRLAGAVCSGWQTDQREPAQAGRLVPDRHYHDHDAFLMPQVGASR